MEMGLHVSGFATGKGQRRHLVAALDRLDPASRGQMKRGAVVVAIVAALVAPVALRAQLGPPKAEVTPLVERAAAAPGSTVHAALQVRLPEGYHTNSNQPRDPNLIPITLTFMPPPAGVT